MASWFARSTKATKKSSISASASSAASAARRSRTRSTRRRRSSKRTSYIDEKIAADLQRIGVEQLKIRSVLTCESERGVCAMCYGRNLATGQFVKLGEAVGIIAAQSIGEPGTQLTMRTFHIGGTASQTFKQPIIKAKNDGAVQFNDLRTVQALDGSWIVLNKNGSISVHNAEGRELERYNVVIGSVISERRRRQVKKGETFVQWDPYNVPILTEKAGKVEFRDMIAGVTMKREVDEATGLMGTVIIEHKEDLHPQIVIVGRQEGSAGELLDSRRRARRRRRRAERSAPARCWPRRRERSPRPRTSPAVCRVWPNSSKRAVRKTPPRSRRSTASSKSAAPCAANAGSFSKIRRPARKKNISSRSTKHIIVFKGDFVKKGQQLTEGPVVPHEILDVCGPQELQEHLVNEVQEVYRLQGVKLTTSTSRSSSARCCAR